METIKSLRMIDDPYFGSTDLCLFNDENKVSVVYGKNGSGKTSISNAIKECLSNNSNYSLLNTQDSPILISDNIRNRSFVFNEEYIDKKVRLSGDAIGTIVLFGEKGKYEDQINDNTSKINIIRNEIDKRDVDKYQRKGDVFCISDSYKKIEKELQENWAKRQQQIKKSARRSPVNAQLIDEILKINNVKETKDLLKKKFDEKLDLVNKAGDRTELIPKISIDLFDFNESDFISQLNEKYNKKVMSDLAQRLLSSYERYNTLDITKKVFGDKEKICPVCLRTIDDSHYGLVGKAFEEAFDDTIKNAQNKLSLFNLNLISTSFDEYNEVLDSKLLVNLTQNIQNYNDIISQYIEYRDVKLSKMYDSLNVQSLSLNNVKEQINKILIDANNFIDEINNIIKKNKENIDELVNINKELASLEVKNLAKSYKTLIDLEIKDKNENQKAENEIDQYLKQNIELRAKANDIHVAMKEINKELSIIFSSKNRLRLVVDETNKKYYVESKGHKVRLNNLSTGERNLIALIYFFEEMKKECKKDIYFRDKYFIVIDDPISSFDYENKLGVYSYLKKMIKSIYDGNKESQILILSHERDVVYYLVKTLDNIRTKSNDKIPHNSLIIMSKNVENFNYTAKADYTYLFDEAFKFASIEDPDKNFESRGNELRKLVEMYSTFVYKTSIDKFFTKKEILDTISDTELRNYFSNNVLWMQLNADSHTEELALQYPNYDTFDLFSVQEQIRIAREILCFLCLINKNHVVAHLDNTRVKTIEKWIEDIKNKINID